MATATATAMTTKMFIDGKWVNSDSGRTLGVINPATEDVIAEVAYGGKSETRRAGGGQEGDARMDEADALRARQGFEENRRADARAGG